MSCQREPIRERLTELARRGVFIGTSSWKYEGWFGQLYTPARYEYRGRVAKTRFQRDCLSEYAAVFKTVCVDAAYYGFPRREYLQGLTDQVPEDFRFGLKVTDAITIKRFPKLARFGAKTGQPNSDFRPGRKYEDAVKAFQPYDKTKEMNEEARQAGRAMIVERERYEPRRKTYIYVNNRLEGNPLETIAAMSLLLGLL